MYVELAILPFFTYIAPVAPVAVGALLLIEMIGSGGDEGYAIPVLLIAGILCVIGFILVGVLGHNGFSWPLYWGMGIAGMALLGLSVFA